VLRRTSGSASEGTYRVLSLVMAGDYATAMEQLQNEIDTMVLEERNRRARQPLRTRDVRRLDQVPSSDDIVYDADDGGDYSGGNSRADEGNPTPPPGESPHVTPQPSQRTPSSSQRAAMSLELRMLHRLMDKIEKAHAEGIPATRFPEDYTSVSR